MQASVPQFIENESRIIGPITIRQFIILGVAIGLGFLFFKVFDLSLFIAATVVVALIAIVFAFVKINGRPFHYFILHFAETFKQGGRFVWQKEVQPIRKHAKKKKKTEKEENTPVQVNYIKVARKKEKARSRLSDLSLLVDTGGYFAKSELDKEK